MLHLLPLVILGQRGQSSTDSDLLQLITAISACLLTYPRIGSVSDLIDVATTQVAVDVCKKILAGNVLLLPDVHNSFKCHAQELVSKYLQENVNVVKLITSSYILSCLTANLQHHVTLMPCEEVWYPNLQSKFGSKISSSSSTGNYDAVLRPQFTTSQTTL